MGFDNTAPYALHFHDVVAIWRNGGTVRRYKEPDAPVLTGAEHLTLDDYEGLYEQVSGRYWVLVRDIEGVAYDLSRVWSADDAIETLLAYDHPEARMEERTMPNA